MPTADEDESIGPSTHSDAAASTDVITTDGVEARLLQRFRLVVAGGPDIGASFTSSGERAIVGTHGASDLRLGDKTVSRFHCEVALQGGRAVVRDLGSRNGTDVDVAREGALADEGLPLRRCRGGTGGERDQRHGRRRRCSRRTRGKRSG